MSENDTFAISRLIIYPIKSCKGIDLGSSACTPDGLLHDRQWMIVDGVSFKALTARQVPRMVLIEPVIDQAANTLRVMLPPTGTKTTVSVAWSWPIPLRSDVELWRSGFELPLELGENERQEWERLPGLDLWGLTLSGLSPPVTHRANRVLSEWFGRPVRIVAKDPEARRAPGKKAVEAGTTGYGEVTTAFADTYALHLVTLPALASFSAAIALSDIPSEVRSVLPEGELGPSTATSLPPSVVQFSDAGPSTSTSSSSSWLSLMSYVMPSPTPAATVQPASADASATSEPFDRSPNGLIDRFRPNIVLVPIKTESLAPSDESLIVESYPEDNWGSLRVGLDDEEGDGERWDMHVVGRCGRCTLPNVDPETGLRHPTLPHRILNTVRPKEVDEFVGMACPTLGVYAVPVMRAHSSNITDDAAKASELVTGRSGRWAVGDQITVGSTRTNVEDPKESK